MLQGIDLMLVDLQDAGARYYTYLATTIEVMQAAARRQLPVLILDRPNPIGGLVQGNVLDTAYRSFIGLLAVPMRHGLTLGEQARLARHDLVLQGTLVVVPARGWTRNLALDDAGLPFIKPSPNLATLEALFHYPGTCLFEGTNLSVGRGTEGAFRQLGAPWLDTTAVLERARGAGLAGVSFESVQFTPRSPGDGKYGDTLVAGLRLTVTDRAAYDPTITAITLLSIIQEVQPDRFRFSPAQFDRLAGGPVLRQQLSSRQPLSAIAASWTTQRKVFSDRVQPFLLYP
jgi:uncharacterized protein YbbC (DUF1343 family)